MDSRALAGLLSSLVSQLLSLLLLLPSSPPPLPSTTITHSHSHSHSPFPRETLLHLIQHFLSSSDLAASLSLLPFSRKRRRTHSPESDSDDEDKFPKLARFDSFFSRTPDSFKLCFRMSSSTFEWLSGLLEPLLDCRDPSGSPLNLPAEVRLGIGLFRLAAGSDYPELAHRFRVSESVTRFCAKQLCRVLCTNFRFWVGFPSPLELASVSNEFEKRAGLPNCCGVVDTARFKLLKSKLCDSKVSQDSIVAQIVVDSESRILSIIAGYRGDKSNAHVLKSSTLYKDVESGSLLGDSSVMIDGVSVNQYMVGTRGYPLFPWLMVPFVDPESGSCEEKFNDSVDSMHGSVIRTIASLKNWGVLSRPMDEEFKTAVAYIGACSILHNVLIMREDYSALTDSVSYEVLHNQKNLGDCMDTSLDKNLVDTEASIMRNALASSAREFWDSKHHHQRTSSHRVSSPAS